MELTAQEIARATDGDWRSGAPDAAFRRVSTDTRHLAQGDLFVALVGERFDAHRFLQQAVDGGAGGLVVNRSANTRHIPRETAVLEVADTLHALGSIGSAWADKCSARRLAVVGSSGKTTTKEMMAAVLAPLGSTHITAGNQNNRIGVPLTLLGLDFQHRWAIVELGMNQPSELAELTRISDPDLLLLVNVGTAHIGRFRSQEDLLLAKGESVRFLQPEAPIVYNFDCENCRAIVRRWGQGHPIMTFSISQPAEVWARNIRSVRGEPFRFDLEIAGRTAAVDLHVFGLYNVANSVAAAAGAFALGADPDAIAHGLSTFRGSAMRSEILQVAGTTFILDCYNANPESMAASLDSLVQGGGTPEAGAEGNTYLVLGDMLELGSAAEEAHRRIGRLVAEMAPNGVFAVGEITPCLIEECASSVAQARHFARKEDLVEDLRSRLRPGDRVFLKGSRGNRLETVAEQIMADLGKTS
ncbi:UDP-N-acetylmuramoyl-tripeptide--D-alanyl-D-alanine ligase [Candidatus Sumerlaeota bacterium]|nr:UDP-N-acetylmuramoyl-tripeptide--D-alanyl-D-alanine ligase [Candidatus Sumerlaeota bacterium]